MMNKSLGVLLLSCIAISANAQLLWKVSGNGLTQPSYIMGTHHLAPLSIKDSIAGLQQAFDATLQVYGELKMADIQKPSTLQMMQKMMITTSDTTFQSLFTPAEYEMINTYSKENLKFDIAMMPKVKPAFLQNNLIVLLYMKHVGGYNPQEQLDTDFQVEATTKGKKIEGLETPEFQFGLLYNATSLKRQAQLLLCMLNNIDKGVKDLQRLTKAYMNQDLDTMLQLSEEREGSQCDPYPGELETMIDRRNHNWAEKLPTIMKAAPTFVAVGALHLPGKKGLLTLLKQKGYTIEPIQ